MGICSAAVSSTGVELDFSEFDDDELEHALESRGYDLHAFKIDWLEKMSL